MIADINNGRTKKETYHVSIITSFMVNIEGSGLPQFPSHSAFLSLVHRQDTLSPSVSIAEDKMEDEIKTKI